MSSREAAIALVELYTTYGNPQNLTVDKLEEIYERFYKLVSKHTGE
jgi:hypothetical protein